MLPKVVIRSPPNRHWPVAMVSTSWRGHGKSRLSRQRLVSSTSTEYCNVSTYVVIVYVAGQLRSNYTNTTLPEVLIRNFGCTHMVGAEART
eukprot:jgi/Botrbrau1/22966/Bobra.0030s0038.1